MKVCVLQPSYEGSAIGYGDYDPPRNLSALLPDCEVQHAFLKKATTYRQLRDLKREGVDVFVNLCEGYVDWDIPSIDVIHALADLDVPFTGANADVYDPTKRTMKLVAWYAGVATPRSVALTRPGEAAEVASRLSFPVFVKPDRGGDSLGVDLASHCPDMAALEAKAATLLEAFDALIVDEYVDGREFSVLVAGDPADPRAPRALNPIEFVFGDGPPFKTYELKVTEYHPERNVPCPPGALNEALKDAARKIFRTFKGVGYCRMDFRMDAAGRLYFLDANFACSIFYPEGSYGTADYILQNDPLGASGFLRLIIAEALARHAARRKPYEVAGDGLIGYGIRASRPIAEGEAVFIGEERYQRLATRAHVEAEWPPEEQAWFRQYAYPVGAEVYVLWDDRPGDWAPQNHSCAPNTAYRGLDVVALRPIAKGEELTLDYATFMSTAMEPFACRCGSPKCRGVISGQAWRFTGA
jgi:D-alanine-D-alanine ligase